jgi:hypothetical protein
MSEGMLDDAFPIKSFTLIFYTFISAIYSIYITLKEYKTIKCLT